MNTPRQLLADRLSVPASLRAVPGCLLSKRNCPLSAGDCCSPGWSPGTTGHRDRHSIGVRAFYGEHRSVTSENDRSPSRPALRRAGADPAPTWCTLPLAEGATVMKPAAKTAPVIRTIPLGLPASSSAGARARLKARAVLVELGWPGDRQTAIHVLHSLVDNAVHHGLTAERPGQRLHASLSITEACELLIDVSDPNPTFPVFDKAVTGDMGGGGLQDATQHGAVLSWFVCAEIGGKTVRATMQPRQVDL